MPFGETTISIPTQNLPSADLNLGSTSTAEKQFITAATATPASAVIYVPLLSAKQLTNGALLRVIAAGRAQATGATNFTLRLYYGISSTIANNTQIGVSTARALASLKHNFFIEAELFWDFDSLKMQGSFCAMVANLYDIHAPLSNVVTAADPTTDVALGFSVTGQFSSGLAANKAFLDVLQICML